MCVCECCTVDGLYSIYHCVQGAVLHIRDEKSHFVEDFFFVGLSVALFLICYGMSGYCVGKGYT
jgi:hypothetical protein